MMTMMMMTFGITTFFLLWLRTFTCDLTYELELDTFILALCVKSSLQVAVEGHRSTIC